MNKKTIAVCLTLIVVGVFLGVFLFRARELGYLDSAIGSLRTLQNSADAYAASHPQTGYPRTLQEMYASALIDGTLRDGVKNHYRYSYLPRVACGDHIDGYQIHADPTDGMTGSHFYMNETGVIRISNVAPANESSPPM